MISLFALGISLNVTIRELNAASPNHALVSFGVVRVVTMAGVVCAQVACRFAGIVSTAILLATAIAHWLASLPDVYALVAAPSGEIAATMPPVLRLYAILWFCVMSAFFILSSFATRRAESAINAHGTSPELNASVLSRLILYWFSPVCCLRRCRPTVGPNRVGTNDRFEATADSRRFVRVESRASQRASGRTLGAKMAAKV